MGYAYGLGNSCYLLVADNGQDPPKQGGKRLADAYDNRAIKIDVITDKERSQEMIDQSQRSIYQEAKIFE